MGKFQMYGKNNKKEHIIKTFKQKSCAAFIKMKFPLYTDNMNVLDVISKVTTLVNFSMWLKHLYQTE